LRGVRSMSALPPKADIAGCDSDVRFVPKARAKLLSKDEARRNRGEYREAARVAAVGVALKNRWSAAQQSRRQVSVAVGGLASSPNDVRGANRNHRRGCRTGGESALKAPSSTMSIRSRTFAFSAFL